VTGTWSDIAQLRLALVYMHPSPDAIVAQSVWAKARD